MNFTNKTFEGLRKRDDIFNAITLTFIILTIVFLGVGGSVYGSETVSYGIALGLLAMGAVSFLLCPLTVRLKRKSLLKFVGLEHGQTVYVVVHRGLRVESEKVCGIEPWNSLCPVTLYSGDYDPEWRNIYLTKEAADEALEAFTSRLCRVVSGYVGYEGPLSRSDRNKIMEGYKKFLANNQGVCPTEFKVEDLVTFIVNHRKEQEDAESKNLKAREALKNSFTGANEGV